MHWASDSPASIQPHCARISVTDFCRASALLGKYGAYSVGFPSPRALIQTGIILTCIFLPNLSDIITDKRPSHCWQRNAFPACVRVKSSWRSPVQHKMWYVDYPPFYYKKKSRSEMPLYSWLLTLCELSWKTNKQTNINNRKAYLGSRRESTWIVQGAGQRWWGTVQSISQQPTSGWIYWTPRAHRPGGTAARLPRAPGWTSGSDSCESKPTGTSPPPFRFSSS